MNIILKFSKHIFKKSYNVNYMIFTEPLEFRINPEYAHVDELVNIVTQFSVLLVC